MRERKEEWRKREETEKRKNKKSENEDRRKNENKKNTKKYGERQRFKRSQNTGIPGVGHKEAKTAENAIPRRFPPLLYEKRIFVRLKEKSRSHGLILRTHTNNTDK